MKKVMNTALVYFGLAMVAGVFYREFTKGHNFSGFTTLGVLHTHLLILGTGVFLGLAIFFCLTDLEKAKGYRRFFWLYNIFLPLTLVMMLVRGIVQVLAISLSSGIDAMISGLAGLGHLGLMVSLLLLLLTLKKELVAKY